MQTNQFESEAADADPMIAKLNPPRSESSPCGAWSMICFLLTLGLWLYACRDRKSADVVPMLLTAVTSIAGLVLGILGWKRREYQLALSKAGIFLNGLLAAPWLILLPLAALYLGSGFRGSNLH